MTIYREKDANLPVFRNTRVAVLGYGNQGRAQALNLRDSGAKTVIGQRPGRGFEQAKADGFKPMSVKEAIGASDVLIMALPDEVAPQVFDEQIAAALAPGQALGFVHGFNIRYGFIKPPEEVDVVLVAPKGPGSLVRSMYVAGKGVPALIAVHQDATGHAKRIALAWSCGIGAARAGVAETTFETETETDLFGEQAVLCGGVIELTKAAFDTLHEAGYEPEVAYLECVHELKQVVDLMYERGLAGMREQISNTAAYGGLTRGPRIVNDQTRAELKRILDEVKSGDFAREWAVECKAGGSKFRQLLDTEVNAPLEDAGRRARALMPWLNG
ncbi:MAG: ketol-acid reductoisomerase [Planctomycetes bacterium]|nr:ketol-acid reductoisomerase [Planctomycetota bacterium]